LSEEEKLRKIIQEELIKRGLDVPPYKGSQILESDIHEWLNQQSNWISLDKNCPDFWNGELFIEIKRGAIQKEAGFNFTSKYFPDIYLASPLDDQIERYPRPLLVIIYQSFGWPPKELARKVFYVP